MIFDWTSFLIVSSVIICGIAGFISIFIVLRRVISYESVFFSLFLLGVTCYVIFYIFLKFEELKFLSYPLQTVSSAILVFGLFMFSYSLKNEGKNLKEIGILLSGFLIIPPLLCFIYTPYTFIIQSYGYELQIDLWFLTLFALISLVPFFNAIYYLLYCRVKSTSLKIRKKIDIIVISLLMIFLSVMIFLLFIPIIFQAHDIKPIGYYLLSTSIVVMAYSFKNEEE